MSGREELIKYLSDKNNVADVLRKFLSQDPSVSWPFYEFSALSQSCLAVTNLRATQPQRHFAQIRDYEMPKTQEEFDTRMQEFYTLYSILQTSKPLEEDTVVYKNEFKDGNLADCATKYTTSPKSKEAVSVTIGKGVHALNVGDYLPELQGMVIIPPFCKEQDGRIVEDVKEKYAQNPNFEMISSSLSSYRYNYEQDYGDYETTYLRKKLF